MSLPRQLMNGAKPMSRSLASPCRHPRCPNLAVRGGYCADHQGERTKRPVEEHRGSARERGYTRAWEIARAAWLKQHPLCAECERQGRVTPATVVDHIVPHRGSRAKFWKSDNFQSLCVTCHQRKTGQGQ